MPKKLKIIILFICVMSCLALLVGILAPFLATNETMMNKVISWVMPKPKTVENATKGIATIKKTQQTNATRNLNGHLFYQMKITVDVTAEDKKQPWEAELKEFVPVEIISQLQPGTRLQILYNAKDSSQVVIPDGNFISE